MEPFIGQIVMFGGNFAPRSWALCDGALLSISQWQALFSILGTTYGGDGRTTFGLPDLRGRVAIHPGNGPGLTPRNFRTKRWYGDQHLKSDFSCLLITIRLVVRSIWVQPPMRLRVMAPFYRFLQGRIFILPRPVQPK
jgi:hypothetical protein